jgi:hypothetical protein
MNTVDERSAESLDVAEGSRNDNAVNRKPALLCDNIIGHTCRGGRNWYYLVFVPYDKNYDETYNALDFIRTRYCKGSPGLQYVCTREKASKVHWNLLISTDYDMLQFHMKPTRRFKLYVQAVKPGEHVTVYNYITKDYYSNFSTNWVLFVDYIYK